MAVSGLRSLFGRFFDTAFGYAVGGAAQSAIDPLINPLAEQAWQEAVAHGDSRALNPADLANMVVQGVIDEGSGAAEAARSGMSGESFHRLFLVNGSPIAPDQALDLWNRGEISEADVDRALVQSRLKPEWVGQFKLLRRQILQGAELAEMVVQGVLPEVEAAARAAHLGLTGDDFARMVRLAGNPPGPHELLDMWNRGIVDEAGVDLGLVQSRLKPEWVERFKRLRRNPPTLGAVVESVIKERITPEQGARLAAEHGIDADTLQLLVDAGGRPMAEGQALTLVRRGEMTEEQFHEVVARSNVRTQYAPFLLKLRTAFPSLYQIKQMLGTGAISDQLARDVLHKEGYPDDLIDGVIAAGHGAKLAGSKQLAQSAILSAYQTKQLARGEAEQLLQGLGYDRNDSGLLLGVADYQRAHAFRSAVISIVRARFLQRDIDEPTASDLLDRAGLAGDERDQYLALWTFDRDSNPRLLTVADLNALVRNKLFTADQYRAYLPRLGFEEPEISLLVALHAGG